MPPPVDVSPFSESCAQHAHANKRSMSAEPPMSVGAQLAVALQRNRELTIELYTMRNESPPDDAGCGQRLQLRPSC